MPFYNDFRSKAEFEERDFERVEPDMTKREKLRALDGLLALRTLLKRSVSPRQTEKNLLIASWNIAGFGDGGRSGEALYYTAEILSVFDLIAVQELTHNRRDLDRVMRILGPNWGYTFNDPARNDGANNESSAFIYNTDRVRPSGLAGELSLWNENLKDQFNHTPPDELDPLVHFAAKRPPHIVGFTTRWKTFSLVNLHLEPSDGPKPRALRMKEIILVLAALKANKGQNWADHSILVGDLNFYKLDQPTINLLNASGFWESPGLMGKVTNVPNRDQHGNLKEGQVFDRMFMSHADFFQIASDGTTPGGGVVDIFDAVMGEDDWRSYRREIIEKRDTAALKEKMRSDAKEAKAYFSKYWRKGQLSDHLPIWIEINTDDTEAFLAKKRAQISLE